MKDFTLYVNNSYPIPGSVVITDGNSPLDIRQTCDTVDDFQTFFERTGMELRYDGLVTYEAVNNLWRMCRKIDGVWVWQEVSSPYTVQVISDRGMIFFNGNINATLTAKVYRGKDEVTDSFQQSAFTWTRTSEDPAADIIWNERAASFHSNVLNITGSDVNKRADFKCHLTYA